MERRDILKLITAATGVAMVGADAFAWDKVPDATSAKAAGFTAEDISLLNEIGETILPATATPGAKKANVGDTMVGLVADCYTPPEQAEFRQGLKAIDVESKAAFSKPFLLLSATQRHELLTKLDSIAKAQDEKVGLGWAVHQKPSHRNMEDKGPVPHYFTLMKQLTLFCFFTSEVGATQALRYVSIPGKYDGDMPYQKGDRAWAT
ncbi:gluconate 2-dehydrogenase subunit 3 family protein [Alteromonas sp. AMM-1]|uniref:gluconate 2-dehydrogenase subunit 3 family protein n=1 Tax=Alteromonas sp. AMM-1 TaxID=3394233 RepID=UPI0039A65DE1